MNREEWKAVVILNMKRRDQGPTLNAEIIHNMRTELGSKDALDLISEVWGYGSRPLVYATRLSDKGEEYPP